MRPLLVLAIAAVLAGCVTVQTNVTSAHPLIFHGQVTAPPSADVSFPFSVVLAYSRIHLEAHPLNASHGATYTWKGPNGESVSSTASPPNLSVDAPAKGAWTFEVITQPNAGLAGTGGGGGEVNGNFEIIADIG
ncbi:MAG: hypothetical protein ACYDCK_04660 [Thermoplasmatota archaeon]